MVTRKREDNASNGFQVPSIPRAPRSIRRRSPHKNLVEDSQICAFELLASLAGKLLQESESSSTSSNASERKVEPAIGKNLIKQELEEEVKPTKTEYIGQGTCELNVLAYDVASQNSDQKFVPKEFQHAESNAPLACASIPTSSDGGLKSESCRSLTAIQISPSKVEVGSPNYGESSIGNIGNGIGRQQDTQGEETRDMTMSHACSSKGPAEFCEKFPDVVNSSSNVKLPMCMDAAPSSLFSRYSIDASLGNRVDDEKTSRYDKPLGNVNSSRLPSRIGDQRIRKLLTSKYWKAAPKLKDCEMSKTAGGIKSVYRKRKNSYRREMCQHDMLYKRRKLLDRSSIVTSEGGFSSESVSNSPEKGMKGDKSSSATTYRGATAVSSSITGHQASFHPNDSQVKFSIKSFKIPELFIEVPETTTVGSLKRTVMEAVTAILGGGLRVGVVLQGKKVRDENRTLLQTGISCKDNLDSLSFTLEPSAVQALPPTCTESPPLQLPCDAPPLLTRSLPDSVLDVENSDVLPGHLSLATLGDQLESNHESASCHTDILTDHTMSDSRALVPVPAMSVEALAVVPINQKPRRSELIQRRTRRPFSVTEVEALVEAVEQLGTGRWRDVKLRSFEDADHRTYVDLKDKWKTLVHTAKIAPQQRRGEAVPQELLDRVLAAHGYWFQHQAKQHGKHQKIVEASGQAVDGVGAERETVAPTVTLM